mgnify:CR=1 FL=1
MGSIVCGHAKFWVKNRLVSNSAWGVWTLAPTLSQVTGLMNCCLSQFDFMVSKVLLFLEILINTAKGDCTVMDNIFVNHYSSYCINNGKYQNHFSVFMHPAISALENLGEINILCHSFGKTNRGKQQTSNNCNIFNNISCLVSSHKHFNGNV